MILLAVGIGCVVLGGLVAAVTEPLGLAHGSWVAAYLVLVGGVAQGAMGWARMGHRGPLRSVWGWVQFGAWNAGNGAVLVGTVLGAPPLVDLGSLMLIVALVIALLAARRSGDRDDGPMPEWLGWIYRLLLLVLALSIPVGIVLSHLRN